MWDMVVLLLPAVIAAAAAGLVYGKKRREKAIVLSSALVSFAVAYAAVLLAGYAGAALLSGAIAVFISLSAFFYLDDNALFYPLVIMGFAYLGLMVLLSGADVSATSFAAACGIGLMAGLEARIYGFRGRKPQKNGRKKLEIRRDVVQIVLGIIVIAVFLAAGRIYGILAVAGLALLGYLFNSASMQAENAVGRFARSFERERAVRGEGALFMAAGSMLILGLVAPVNYALFGLSAIFFADSAATIVGVGLCLDTCHAFAAGYDLAKPDAAKAAFEEMRKHVGEDRLMLFHLNDAKFPLGSGLDRHWHIGKGFIGEKGFLNIFSEKLAGSSTFIMETPENAEGNDASNLAATERIISKAGMSKLIGRAALKG